MSDFKLPSLGADMEAGTLVEWLVKPGDRVAKGDVVAVVETQKGAIEIEIFEDGVIEELRVPPGRKVPVGTVLATLRTAGGAAPPAPTATPEPAPEPPAPTVAPAPPSPSSPAPPPPVARDGVRASPVARRRAAALGVDLDTLTGSGPGGAITLADVEAAAAAPAPTEAAPTAEAARKIGFDPAAMRQAIAAAMARSKREIPHYYLGQTIDMSRASAWLRDANAARPVEERLLYGVLLLKATALALRQVPQLNGFWIDGRAEPSDRIHVGWAISLRGGGLMAPAIHDADRKSLGELMAALRDLVTRARTGRIRGSEMTDPTITVTSLGERGAGEVYGVIYPPQLAIVGFGALLPRPLAVEDRVEVRQTVTATLAGDHRASDGMTGGRLLAAIDSLLQEPETL